MRKITGFDIVAIISTIGIIGWIITDFFGGMIIYNSIKHFTKFEQPYFKEFNFSKIQNVIN